MSASAPVEERSPHAPPAPRPSLASSLVRAARPRQWTKNLLVFAAPAAGGVLGHRDVLWSAIGAFVAFCLVSSATYMLNDLADADADRMHPVKRSRPIAAGLVPTRAAVAAIALLLAAGLALAYAISWQLGLLLTGYKALTVAYTFRLKHTPTVDMVVVASGFMVR